MLNLAVGGWQVMLHFERDIPDLPQSRSFARVLQPDNLTLLKEAEQIIAQGDAVFESATNLSLRAGLANIAPSSLAPPSLASSSLAPLSVGNPALRDTNLASVPDAQPNKSRPSGEANSKPVVPNSLDFEVLEYKPSVSAGSASAPQQCQAVGPYSKKSEAQRAIHRLSASSVSGVLSIKPQSHSQVSYWVYVEPYKTKQLAFREWKRIEKMNIDSFLIMKSELKHGISLGMFTNRDFAERQKQVVSELGYRVKIKALERTSTHYWVQVKGEGLAGSSLAYVNRVIKQRPSLKIKEDFCSLDIAYK